MESIKLGVLGGVGPLASVYFADLIVNMTDAATDQEHIPLVMYNDNLIPDRTAYILGMSRVNPFDRMLEDINKLADFGANYAVITCNTAHYFYDELSAKANIPIVNMIEETVSSAIRNHPHAKRIGVLATDGTVQSGVYKKEIEKHGLTCITPSHENQEVVMDIIYSQVKAGKEADLKALLSVIAELRREGCEVIILGCTELSVINRKHDLSLHSGDITDAMEELAKKCIFLCGKPLKR